MARQKKGCKNCSQKKNRAKGTPEQTTLDRQQAQTLTPLKRTVSKQRDLNMYNNFMELDGDDDLAGLLANAKAHAEPTHKADAMETEPCEGCGG